MIIKYSDPIKNGFSGVLRYHEKKEKEGIGKEIFSTMKGHDLSQKIKHMDQTKASKKAENFGYDISFNFDLKDSVNDTLALKIIGEYLNDTGFQGHDFVVNKHLDKKHQHYHLTISNYNRVGERNLFMGGFYKKESVELARGYEAKYGLHFEHKRLESDRSLGEINAEKYAYQRLAKQYLAENVEYREGLDDLVKLRLSDEHLTNSQVKALFRKNKEVLQYCERNAPDILKKKVLIREMRAHKKNSSDLNVYLHKLRQDYYLRFTGATGNKSMNVGKEFGGEMFYLKEQDLPEDLKYKYLVNNGLEKVPNKSVEQKSREYIKKMADRFMKSSDSYEGFKSDMRAKGVEIKEHSNKRGVYGITFVTEKDGVTYEFKASQIDRNLSFTKINQRFDVRKPYKSYAREEEREKTQKVKQSPRLPRKKIRSKAEEQNDQEVEQHVDKERKFKEENNNEFER